MGIDIRSAVMQYQSSRSPGSRVEDFLKSLSDEDRSEVEDVLHDPTIQTRALWKALTKLGLVVGETTFRDYRRSLREG